MIDSCKRGSTPSNPVVPGLQQEQIFFPIFAGAYFDVGVTAWNSLITELYSCSPVRIVRVSYAAGFPTRSKLLHYVEQSIIMFHVSTVSICLANLSKFQS